MTVIDRRFSVAEGLAIKAPCRAATTANVTLSGLQTIDGVTLAEHDRVLVKNQTDQTTNGIYEASSGNWQRTKDFDGALDIVTGTRVFVTSGTTNADTEFMVSTTGEITVGESNIVFEEFVSASISQAQGYAAAAAASASEASGYADDALNASASETAYFAFPDKATATSFPTPSYVPFLFTDGRVSAGKGRGYWAPVSGNVEPAHGEFILTNGRYFEPSPDGAIFMQQFGLDPTYTDDNNAAIQRCLAFGLEKGLSVMWPGPGEFKVATQLPFIQQGIHILGSGRGNLGQTGITAFTRNYDEADASRGLFAFFACNNVRLQDFDIIAQGSDGGSAISFQSSAGVAMGYTTVDSLYLTADSGASFDNVAAYLGGLHVNGTRSNFILNTQIFGANNNSLFLQSPVHFVWNGGGAFTAGGTVANVTIEGVGGGGVGPFAEDVLLNCEGLLGSILLDKAKRIRISATQIGGNIINTSDVSFTHIEGPFSNPSLVCQNNWDKKSCFFNGENLTEVSSTDGYRWRPGAGGARLEQWMQVTVTSTSAAYSFPIAFPNKLLDVQVSTLGLGGSDNIVVTSTSLSQVALRGTGSLIALVRATGY